MHINNPYCRKAVQTLKRHALRRFTDHGLTLVDTRLCPDLRSQLQTDNAYHWQFSGTMLSAGTIFFLGMAMNATTIWGVQRNILELAGVSKDIQKLVAHSSNLGVSMEHRLDSQEMVLPAKPATPHGGSAVVEMSLTQPVQAGKASADIGGKPPSASPPTRTAAHKREPGERLAYGKWGPPLLLNAAQATTTVGEPDGYSHGKEIQSNLLALGFDVREDYASGQTGRRTLQALNEFRLLYLPAAGRQKLPDRDQLTTSVRKFATLARKDEKKFSIDSGVLAAIRLGSMRTGVEFSFLMELAAAESTFDPTKIAPKTGAAGLYQFKDDTWLDAVKTYGKKYGMGSYASQVENYIDDEGKTRLTIHDSVVHQHVLALRHNPRISALLAAEYVNYNRKQLSNTLDREPGHTDLYLTHFFGASGAISFLKVLYENPDRIAGEVFPKAAENNQSIFRPQRSKPRTVAEIYKMFDRKFNTSRYKDTNPS